MAQATTKDWLDGIQKGLLQQLTENKGALPKGFNQDRFILNSITVIRDMLRDSKKKKQLQEIDYTSIPICLAKGAFLGLDFFNGECYAIPYGGEMKFQTDYKGEIKLCKRYSKNPGYRMLFINRSRSLISHWSALLRLWYSRTVPCCMTPWARKKSRMSEIRTQRRQTARRG